MYIIQFIFIPFAWRWCLSDSGEKVLRKGMILYDDFNLNEHLDMKRLSKAGRRKKKLQTTDLQPVCTSVYHLRSNFSHFKTLFFIYTLLSALPFLALHSVAINPSTQSSVNKRWFDEASVFPAIAIS